MNIGLKNKELDLLQDDSLFGLHSDSFRIQSWRKNSLDSVFDNVQLVHSYRRRLA